MAGDWALGVDALLPVLVLDDLELLPLVFPDANRARDRIPVLRDLRHLLELLPIAPGSNDVIPMVPEVPEELASSYSPKKQIIGNTK